jgi:hypothetical protein
VGQLDALAHIANHRFALAGHGTRQIAIGRHGAQRQFEFSGQIAEAFAVVGRQIHRRRMRPLGIQLQSLPALVLGQLDQAEHIDSGPSIPDAAIGDAVHADFHCLFS